MIRRMRPHLALALVVTAVALWAAGGGMWLPMVRQAHSPSNVIVAATLARQPLLFVANSGQAEPWSTFVAQGETTSVLFGPGGARVRLAKAGAARSLACRGKHGDGVCLGAIGAGGPPDPLAPLSAGARAGDAARGTVDAVELAFVGGRDDVVPVAEARAATTVSFFSGPRAAWRTRQPTYQRLVYRAVWSGIDVAFDGEASGLKQTFTVAPGADPAAIALAWRGARSLRVDGAGRLIVGTTDGDLVDAAPVAWQEVGGRRVAVEVGYRLDDEEGARPCAPAGKCDGLAYGFGVGEYDPTRPLVIDPAVVAWAGFLGVAGTDRGLGIALGPDGAVWVTGERGTQTYVAKLKGDGSVVEHVALLDADGSIAGFDIAVDGAGFAYVTGAVIGDGGGAFPFEGGPDGSYNGGAADGFVAKFAPDGADLVYCGYLGGAAVDFGEGVVVDGDGHAYLSGLAESTEATFPVTVGPDLTHNGDFDAYVLKLKPNPTSSDVAANYAYAGFVGGSGLDVTVTDDGWLSSGHIGIDAVGAAYLSGQTTSHEDTFPDGDGLGDLPTFDGTHNGGDWDAYVAKVRPDGAGLAYAGFLGGSADDDGKGMAIDSDGAAVVTGATLSDDFPARVGPDLTYNGMYDTTLTKIAPDGRSLVWSGFVGGDDDEQGQAVALGPDGAVYVTGRTESVAATFPATGGPDGTHNGPKGLSDDADEGDAFIGRLAAEIDDADPRGNWDYLGYVGGDQGDGAYWVAVDSQHRAHIVGDVDSGAATFPDGDGMGPLPTFDGIFKGATDAFVARIDWRPPPSLAFLPWLGRAVGRDDVPPPAAVTLAPTPTPRPTNTRRPTNTPAPTARPTKAITPPAGEEVVFFDDFGDTASGWQVMDEDGDVWRYVDDEFEVATDVVKWITAPFAPRRVSFGDGALTATARLAEGSDASYGLIFGASTPYLFALNGGGRWGVYKIAGGSLSEVLPMTNAFGIPNAPGTAVRLRVERDGTTAVLFIDGARKGQVTNDDLAGPGQPGLFIYAGNNTPAGARFDDFLVTRWTAERATPTAGP
ncbi:MAG: hypothetical protein IPG72_02415 [Ardenticatenales bacterium]|nr:hypothetical protein [Ardenticatenales bacterium]